MTGIQAEIARLVRSAAGTGRGLSVYDEISPNFYAATSRTFAGQLLRLFGLRNVADRAPDVEGLGYPQLSAEYLLAANPDIVLLSDTICCAQTAAVVARRPGWSQVTAVRHHTIVPINDDIASRWGPRMVDLAAAIAHAVDSAHAAGLARLSSSATTPARAARRAMRWREAERGSGLRWWWALSRRLPL